MKLQDAYVSESNNIGGWTLIGYVMAETTNFKYEGDTGSGLTSVTTGKEDAWKATTKVALNDCTTSSGVWTIDVVGNSNGNSVSYRANTPSCGAALTPSFGKMTTPGVAAKSN